MITNKNIESKFQLVEEQMSCFTEKLHEVALDIENVSYKAAQFSDDSKNQIAALRDSIDNCFRRSDEQIEQVAVKLDKISNNTQKRLSSIEDLQEKLFANIDALSEQMAHIGDALAQMSKELNRSKKVSEEAVWAAVFNNTIADCQWLEKRSFSPGRWAMGYPALYALFRILNDMKPKRILELGLGQSTRMICQYAGSNDSVEHYVVENDPSWTEFFCNTFYPSKQTTFCTLPLEMREYKEIEAIRAFQGFADTFSSRKFDLICVDAPQGVDMKVYSRIDVLSIIPNSLDDSFAIIVDDSNRSGEKGTIREIETILTDAGIKFTRGTYVGQKNTTVICSEDQKYLCTL